MAFFKFRKVGDDAVSAPSALESVDAMRRRAMHRLIGAVVLVVAGVIGFPMLFDNQPRPIAVDIPIEIPDKTKARPIVLPAVAPAVENAPAPATIAKDPPAEAKPVEQPVAAIAKKPSDPAKSVPSPLASPVVPPVASAPKPLPPPSSVADAAKAQALLDGKAAASPDVAASAAGGRFVVQVGAFADSTKATETRTRLERAGLKTYTQVVETKDGPRTRVRVGPFGDRAQAESSASKIKALDLPASILVL